MTCPCGLGGHEKASDDLLAMTGTYQTLQETLDLSYFLLNERHITKQEMRERASNSGSSKQFHSLAEHVSQKIQNKWIFRCRKLKSYCQENGIHFPPGKDQVSTLGLRPNTNILPMQCARALIRSTLEEIIQQYQIIIQDRQNDIAEIEDAIEQLTFETK